MKTKERVLWFFLLVAIAIACHFERKQAFDAYKTQTERLTNLSKHHWEIKEKNKKLRQAGYKLASQCKAIIVQCEDIIKNKRNCAYGAEFMERNTL